MFPGHPMPAVAVPENGMGRNILVHKSFLSGPHDALLL